MDAETNIYLCTQNKIGNAADTMLNAYTLTMHNASTMRLTVFYCVRLSLRPIANKGMFANCDRIQA